MKVVAFDTETFRIRPGHAIPEIVCGSFSYHDNGTLNTFVLGNHPEDGLRDWVERLLTKDDITIVGHKLAYDLAVVCVAWPDLIPLVFDKLRNGLCTDTLWREKLLGLSSHGHVTDYATPDGRKHRIGFQLADLESKYLGIDRSEEKDADDAWRLNYHLLDGQRASEYPTEARDYAMDDAANTLYVYYAQQQRHDDPDDPAVFDTHQFRTAVDFVLQLITAWGVRIDQEEVANIRAVVEEELAPENLEQIVATGILRPAEPPRPHARGAKDHAEDCPRKKGCDCPVKMTAGKKASVNEKKLKAHILGVCRDNDLPVPITDSGRKAAKTRKKRIPADNFDDPEYIAYVSYKGEELDLILAVVEDAPLAEFRRRQSLAKVVNDWLPRLGYEVVHVPFDALKETGRVSSFMSKKDTPLGEKGNLIPQVNGTQAPRIIKTPAGREVDIRSCFIPREGRAFIDADFSALELVCTAQSTYDVLGFSRHMEIINAGIDPHAYLGSQIACLFGKGDVETAWQNELRREGLEEDPMGRYESFIRFKDAEEEELLDFFDNYRTMAKPVGLGFPGGLGPEKLATAIAPVYGVKINFVQAKTLKEIWLSTYPEMRPWFEWIQQQTDPENSVIFEDDEGEQMEGFWYETPLGMIRRGASYCACANGKAMQSPGAEAALMATFDVERACLDPSMNSVLYGCRPWNFVHDQLLLETTEDKSLWHEQAMEVKRLMQEGASRIFTDVRINVDPVLCSVWSKKAKAVWEGERLAVWSPS